MKRTGFKNRYRSGEWLKRAPLKRNSSLTRLIAKTKGRRKAKGIAGAGRRWSLAVRMRDDFQCQFPECLVRDKSIDTHHVSPRSRRPDLKFQTSNGICLCRLHHDWCHANPVEATMMNLLSDETYEAAMKERAA